MNDVIAFLGRRRSVSARLLGPPGPSGEDLDTILTIASRVPDHGKLTPWRFLVIEGDARRRVGTLVAEAYAADHPEAGPEGAAREGEKLERAPLVIAVVSRVRPHVKIPEWEQHLSVGAACMSALTAALALGYGACWLSDWFSTDRRVLDAMGLAAEESVAGYIYVGTAREAPAERPRPALDAIVQRL